MYVSHKAIGWLPKNLNIVHVDHYLMLIVFLLLSFLNFDSHSGPISTSLWKDNQDCLQKFTFCVMIKDIWLLISHILWWLREASAHSASTHQTWTSTTHTHTPSPPSSHLPFANQTQRGVFNKFCAGNTCWFPKLDNYRKNEWAAVGWEMALFLIVPIK